MTRDADTLRQDALAIWQAGLQAVRSDRLIQDAVQLDGQELRVGDELFLLNDWERIVVVGGGKAGAGMVSGIEQVLAPVADAKQLQGWLNVPDDCVQSTNWIHLHGARPAGRNEPTAEGVEGVQQILSLLRSLGSRDLVLCLISGGGSALLPAPIEGVTLADKLEITRFLSEAGANIAELNTVRKSLSAIKGGGLADACRGGMLVSLIISDVLGDPLDVIASGPTVPSTTGADDAVAVLQRFESESSAGAPVATIERLVKVLRAHPQQPRSGQRSCPRRIQVIGNNATAVDAAGVEAEKRGYSHAMSAARELEASAESVGRHLADMAERMRSQPGPDCLITGGEPTVTLADAAVRGRGGRNQQLVLAAFQRLRELSPRPELACDHLALLSGGTDGEDGPTDAAGAIIDAPIEERIHRLDLDPHDYLQRNDAYHFFDPVDGLLRTGPTHTNVCDLRVVTVSQR